MEQSALRLPIRLVPRKGGQIVALLGSMFMVGFALFWTGGALDILDINALDINAFDWQRVRGRPFALLGLVFVAIGLSGMVRAIIRMLPGSPYYHLQVSGDGLLVRNLFTQRHHAWRDLPRFETLQVEKSGKHGKTILHYTVAMGVAASPADTPHGATYGRETIRILADQYGAKKGDVDADVLAQWLNHLRAMALEKRLGANEMIEIPEGFRATAFSVSGGAARDAQRSQTVVRR